MIKHYTEKALLDKAREIIAGGEYPCKHRGDGRAGVLFEELLGIDSNNYDVADAVGFEIKTSLSKNTPTTLFHKDPHPRNSKNQIGAINKLVFEHGWESQHKDSPVLSFRATVWGKYKHQKNDNLYFMQKTGDNLQFICNGEVLAYWDCNELVGVASAKLKNILHVDASAEGNMVNYNKASLCRTFQPLKFLDAVVDGVIAVDFDARSNPGKENSVRNHGTKFRIKIKDHPKIYQNIETL